MARDFAKAFYKSAAWKRCRAEYAAQKQYLCENCLRRGIYTPGRIVHHKVELTPQNITNPEITLNPDNLELLCHECHLNAHRKNGGHWAQVLDAQKEARFIILENGEVIAKDDKDKLDK